jgi:hypothetical protein
MHYPHFEEYTNRVESLVNCIETERRGFNFFLSFFFSLTLFMYHSDPLWRKKMFDFNYMIIVGIYLLNNAKISSKYDTGYFQSLIK